MNQEIPCHLLFLSPSPFCSLRSGKWVVLMHYSTCNSFCFPLVQCERISGTHCRHCCYCRRTLNPIQFNVSSRQSISTSNSHHLIIAARFRIIRRWCSLSVYCVYPCTLYRLCERCAFVHEYINCSCCRRRAAVQTIHLLVFVLRAAACIFISCRRRVCIHRSPETWHQNQKWSRALKFKSTMSVLLNFYSVKLYPKLYSAQSDVVQMYSQ